MSDIKIEALAGMAKEFKDSAFGKYLIDFAKTNSENLVVAAMNADTSDGQLKGLNQSAGVRLITDHIDSLVFFAEHPETLNNQKQS